MSACPFAAECLKGLWATGRGECEGRGLGDGSQGCCQLLTRKLSTNLNDFADIRR